MDIQEIRKKKDDLDFQINKLVMDFQTETGAFVSDVSVICQEMLGGPSMIHIQTQVKI